MRGFLLYMKKYKQIVNSGRLSLRDLLIYQVDHKMWTRILNSTRDILDDNMIVFIQDEIENNYIIYENL